MLGYLDGYPKEARWRKLEAHLSIGADSVWGEKVMNALATDGGVVLPTQPNREEQLSTNSTLQIEIGVGGLRLHGQPVRTNVGENTNLTSCL